MTTTADPIAPATDAVPPRAATAGVRVRDPRLDFYRGIAMMIIFIAHVPGNRWTLWIPARFGYSDATEIFVFCSGMASAIAFGAAFDKAGWALGAVRVAHRVWQVYWAHIGLFLAVAALLAGLDLTGAFDKVYIGTLNLWRFFEEDPRPLLVGLMTLTYVPNYFDILPMYLVILCMIPVVMALSRVHLGLVAVFVGAVWLAAQSALWPGGGIDLPAEPWSDRRWFFNPFGWQLVFFTGFAFMRGWLPAPPVRVWLVALALLVVVGVAVFLSNVASRELGFGFAREIRSDYRGLTSKTDFALFRYLHFLALAYLAWVIVGSGGRALNAPEAPRLWLGLVAIITKVGQQSLAVFLFSMFWARVTGVGLDVFGRDGLTFAVANLSGIVLLTGVAYLVAWIKSQPWKAAGR